MNKSKYVVIGMAVIAGLGAFAWRDSISGIIKSEHRTDQPIAPVVRPVPTAVVREVPQAMSRTFPGTVRATSRVELAFSIDGHLKELNGQEGRRVKKGEVLARLDHRDNQHELDAAQARLSDAKLAFERAEDLFERKVISKAKYDTAKTAYQVAEAEQRIRAKALEDTVMLAPFDGIVARRYVENHEHIKKQTAILSLKDLSLIEVVIQVSERLIARGGTGEFRNIAVRFDAGHGDWYKADVREFSVQSDPVTRTYSVVVGLLPPDNLQVLPGMTATVRMETTSATISAAQSVYSIPVEALFGGSDGGSYTWVIPGESGAPRRVQVTIGSMRGDRVEILQGLSAGQRVATAGVHTLQADMQVRPAADNLEGLDG